MASRVIRELDAILDANELPLTPRAAEGAAPAARRSSTTGRVLSIDASALGPSTGIIRSLAVSSCGSATSFSRWEDLLIGEDADEGPAAGGADHKAAGGGDAVGMPISPLQAQAAAIVRSRRGSTVSRRGSVVGRAGGAGVLMPAAAAGPITTTVTMGVVLSTAFPSAESPDAHLPAAAVWPRAAGASILPPASASMSVTPAMASLAVSRDSPLREFAAGGDATIADAPPLTAVRVVTASPQVPTPTPPPPPPPAQPTSTVASTSSTSIGDSVPTQPALPPPPLPEAPATPAAMVLVVPALPAAAASLAVTTTAVAAGSVPPTTAAFAPATVAPAVAAAAVEAGTPDAAPPHPATTRPGTAPASAVVAVAAAGGGVPPSSAHEPAAVALSPPASASPGGSLVSLSEIMMMHRGDQPAAGSRPAADAFPLAPQHDLAPAADDARTAADISDAARVRPSAVVAPAVAEATAVVVASASPPRRVFNVDDGATAGHTAGSTPPPADARVSAKRGLALLDAGDAAGAGVKGAPALSPSAGAGAAGGAGAAPLDSADSNGGDGCGSTGSGLHVCFMPLTIVHNYRPPPQLSQQQQQQLSASSPPAAQPSSSPSASSTKKPTASPAASQQAPSAGLKPGAAALLFSGKLSSPRAPNGPAAAMRSPRQAVRVHSTPPASAVLRSTPVSARPSSVTRSPAAATLAPSSTFGAARRGSATTTASPVRKPTMPAAAALRSPQVSLPLRPMPATAAPSGSAASATAGAATTSAESEAPSSSSSIVLVSDQHGPLALLPPDCVVPHVLRCGFLVARLADSVQLQPAPPQPPPGDASSSSPPYPPQSASSPLSPASAAAFAAGTASLAASTTAGAPASPRPAGGSPTMVIAGAAGFAAAAATKAPLLPVDAGTEPSGAGGASAVAVSATAPQPPPVVTVLRGSRLRVVAAASPAGTAASPEAYPRMVVTAVVRSLPGHAIGPSALRGVAAPTATRVNAPAAAMLDVGGTKYASGPLLAALQAVVAAGQEAVLSRAARATLMIASPKAGATLARSPAAGDAGHYATDADASTSSAAGASCTPLEMTAPVPEFRFDTAALAAAMVMQAQLAQRTADAAAVLSPAAAAMSPGWSSAAVPSAALQRLQPGDIILSIDGTAVDGSSTNEAIARLYVGPAAASASRLDAAASTVRMRVARAFTPEAAAAMQASGVSEAAAVIRSPLASPGPTTSWRSGRSATTPAASTAAHASFATVGMSSEPFAAVAAGVSLTLARDAGARPAFTPQSRLRPTSAQGASLRSASDGGPQGRGHPLSHRMLLASPAAGGGQQRPQVGSPPPSRLRTPTASSALRTPPASLASAGRVARSTGPGTTAPAAAAAPPASAPLRGRQLFASVIASSAAVVPSAAPSAGVFATPAPVAAGPRPYLRPASAQPVLSRPTNGTPMRRLAGTPAKQPAKPVTPWRPASGQVSLPNAAAKPSPVSAAPQRSPVKPALPPAARGFVAPAAGRPHSASAATRTAPVRALAPRSVAAGAAAARGAAPARTSPAAAAGGVVAASRRPVSAGPAHPPPSTAARAVSNGSSGSSRPSPAARAGPVTVTPVRHAVERPRSLSRSSSISLDDAQSTASTVITYMTSVSMGLSTSTAPRPSALPSTRGAAPRTGVKPPPVRPAWNNNTIIRQVDARGSADAHRRSFSAAPAMPGPGGRGLAFVSGSTRSLLAPVSMGPEAMARIASMGPGVMARLASMGPGAMARLASMGPGAMQRLASMGPGAMDASGGDAAAGTDGDGVPLGSLSRTASSYLMQSPSQMAAARRQRTQSAEPPLVRPGSAMDILSAIPRAPSGTVPPPPLRSDNSSLAASRTSSSGNMRVPIVLAGRSRGGSSGGASDAASASSSDLSATAREAPGAGVTLSTTRIAAAAAAAKPAVAMMTTPAAAALARDIDLLMAWGDNSTVDSGSISTGPPTTPPGPRHHAKPMVRTSSTMSVGSVSASKPVTIRGGRQPAPLLSTPADS